MQHIQTTQSHSTQQYVNHWEDVVVGAAIGFAFAYFGFSMYYFSDGSPYLLGAAAAEAVAPEGSAIDAPAASSGGGEGRRGEHRSGEHQHGGVRRHRHSSHRHRGEERDEEFRGTTTTATTVRINMNPTTPGAGGVQ
jgi:hypothetical protein